MDGRGVAVTKVRGAAAAVAVHDFVAGLSEGRDAITTAANYNAMVAEIRSPRRRGVALMALLAVDSAFSDLIVLILGVPRVSLIGAARPVFPLYGSRGF